MAYVESPIDRIVAVNFGKPDKGGSAGYETYNYRDQPGRAGHIFSTGSHSMSSGEVTQSFQSGSGKIDGTHITVGDGKGKCEISCGGQFVRTEETPHVAFDVTCSISVGGQIATKTVHVTIDTVLIICAANEQDLTIKGELTSSGGTMTTGQQIQGSMSCAVIRYAPEPPEPPGSP